MAVTTTNYQCPACTGPLRYSPETGMTECEYCGSVYELAEIEALYKKEEEAKAETAEQPQSDWGETADGMKTYSCPSCTAELICDASTAATSCPYCGNPTVVPGQFHGALKPDFVIPFRKEKEDAVAALKQHYQKRFFLPKSFKSENHIQQVQGVYVPFWLFDGEAEGSAEFEATKSRSYVRGEYRITETAHYAVSRSGSLAFEKIPVDASTKMPDGHMDSIEPYDYSDLQPFSTAYLPGFLADKFDVEETESRRRADERSAGSLVHELEETVVGYDTVSHLSKDVEVHHGKTQYALMPVWMLNTKWQGKDFLFAMNGQTGKLVGDLPVDQVKFWLTFGIIGVVLSVISSLLVLNFAAPGETGMPMMIAIAASLIIALLVCGILRSGMKNVHVGTEAAEYITGSLSLTARQDRYTHTTTSRVKISNNSKK